MTDRQDSDTSPTAEPTSHESPPAAAAPTAPQTAAVPPGLPWWLAAAALVAAFFFGGQWWIATGHLTRANDELATVRQQLAEARRQMASAQSSVDHARQQLDILSAPDLVRVDLAGQAVAPSAAGRIYWSRSRGLTLSAANLPPLSTGHIYQLWLVTGAGPVSAALVSPDQAGRFDAILLGATSVEPTGFAVTLEPDGGSAGPTGPMQLLGSR